VDRILNSKLSNLVVYRCPLGCDGNCAGVWINDITGYRIVCKCKCKHNETLAKDSKPDANVIKETPSSQEETQGNVPQ
jgi:hypothetical protein